MVLLQSLLSIDEVEQQKHQAYQTLKYRFPEKQILESNKTKQQLQNEEEHPQQPEDPGSPMQAISEKSSQVCAQSQFNNSCPTTMRINAHQTNDCSFQHDQRLSIKKISYSPPILNNQSKQKQKYKGIIKKSRFNSDSQSPNSSQTIKSVRFLITEQVRVQQNFKRTRSLQRRQSNKRQNKSIIYTNCNYPLYYKIEL
ncbi:unnamed protein product (macronuclear) [Paramecium tetraurelia]|uniref:Uncharacterized protein n=1 Tax=Paramecium tetraurelia TaxID=5888 RepID=A0E412_PARTE|nr:uncharacterized protein GSPATT00023202001 [Paramecium tetraurelia]CAK90029.1 unnamed protein product [Paramecium tetraurelia]|eukprot:XP_001457426.1 hypothetical protein (macronuclear) [Paramecium tetraurelia strain d4-2]